MITAKIFLVDNDADVRRTLKMLLREADHDVDDAMDATDAIARCGEHRAPF